VIYLRQLLWPEGLAFFYPYEPHALTDPKVVAAAVLLVGITLAAVWLVRTRPYLLVGWFWYLGTLVPVIGFIQVGDQAHADRYTYLPCIGLLIAIIWGLADLQRHWAIPPNRLAWAIAIVLVWWSAATLLQINYWQNTRSLLQRHVDVLQNDAKGFCRLADHLQSSGDYDGAMRNYEAALRILPGFFRAHNNFGVMLLRHGRLEQAETHLIAAVRIEPENTEVHASLATLFLRLGKTDQAAVEFRAFLHNDPGNPLAHFHYGQFLDSQNQWDSAIAEYSTSIQLQPDKANVHHALGQLLRKMEQQPQAIAALRKAVELQPGVVKYHCDLAYELYRAGSRAEAKTHYREATRLDPEWHRKAYDAARELVSRPTALAAQAALAVESSEQVCQATDFNDPILLDFLAMAYATVGNFDSAVRTSQDAYELAKATGLGQPSRRIEEHLRFFEASRLPDCSDYK
jgi:tetratricopeptide (TPR) repeat protein